ncbi:MAG TPA: transglutaminaseTgpA domain-containing protein [Gaiellaceae bacterium]|nr:transglutaminaseTgpA domain-containing protein [Gaiellaceae bacterium]
MLRTTALSGIAALVIAVDWLRFEDPRSGGGRPFVLVVLAIAPAPLRPLWARAAAAAIAVFFAACVAFSVGPLHAASAPGRFERGFLDFYDFRLPFDPQQNVRMHEVVLLAIFGFALAVALCIAARRAVLAVVVFLIGAGWPATLLAGGNELGRGVFILGVALVLLAGLTERPSRLALGAGALVVVGAFALSSSAAVAKNAFLDWQHWDFYTRPEKPVSVRYVWDGRYDGVRFPKKTTTVLSIRAPRTPMYWRATVLDHFDGTRWLEHLSSDQTADSLWGSGAADRRKWIRQDVTVRALDDKHLVGASIPVAYNISDPAVANGDGVVRVVDGLHRDQRYTIWSYTPRPTPAQLVRVPASYPRVLTKPGRELELAGRVNAPPFSALGREQRMFALLTGRLQPYAELYDRARSVAGQTRSPYAAAVALERWFRVTGGFTYSEEPGPTPGLPPLVGFVVDTRTGYCQHFAGAMALMLRLLGIPARVAAGFVPGHYQGGTWTVTDRDAHTWVEVWFPRYGWLAFDPTPGRGRLSGSYSSTSVNFNASAAAKLLAGVVKGGEVFGGGAPAIVGHDDRIRTPRSAADVPVRGLHAPPPAQERTPSLLLFLALLAAGLAALIMLLKLGRRKLRYLTRDPRRVASACALELAEFLQDQRVTPSRAATLHELGAAISERFGVDAQSFAEAAAVARYGPRAEAHAAARRARTELREVKRKLRRGLFVLDRVRGLVSVRSLGLG